MTTELQFEKVTETLFTEILPISIQPKTNEDALFSMLVENGDETVQKMIERLCRRYGVQIPYEGNGFSVGHAYEESLELWLLRIHNEIPESATIRNFYTLFQIKDREAVVRECYLSYEVDEERFCGRFIKDGSLKFFENEFLDEDDETDTIVNHYRKKYKLISNIAG